MAVNRAVRIIGRAALATGIAIGVNAGILAALLWLNATSAQPSRPEAPAVVMASLTPPKPDRPEPRSQTEPEKNKPDPMQLAADTPLPEPTPPTPKPLHIEVSAPTPQTPAVSVNTAIKVPRKPDRAESNTARQTSERTSNANEATAVTQLREQPGNPRPKYPTRAMRRGVEGTVVVRLTVSPAGRVQKAEFLDGPETLRDAVRDVIDEYVFEPTRRDGQPVRAVATKRFLFRIPD